MSDHHRMGEAGIFAPDERVELIDGEIILVPPVGPEHASLVDQLVLQLVRRVGDEAIVRSASPVRLSDRSEPEPDLALLRPRDHRDGKAPPTPADTLLAIEVSDSTLAYDRNVKAPLYARHAIPELWLVDAQGRRVVVYREPDRTQYASMSTHRSPVILEPTLLPG